MGNRLIFLYLVLLRRGTEKAMLAGRRLSRFKRVGWFSVQIRKIKAEA